MLELLRLSRSLCESYMCSLLLFLPLRFPSATCLQGAGMLGFQVRKLRLQLVDAREERRFVMFQGAALQMSAHVSWLERVHGARMHSCTLHGNAQRA